MKKSKAQIWVEKLLKEIKTETETETETYQDVIDEILEV
mgnify:CR=1 FL=1